MIDDLHGAALAEAMRGLRGTRARTVPVPIDLRLDPLAELVVALLAREARRRT